MDMVNAFSGDTFPELKPLDKGWDDMTRYPCYGQPKTITLSWSRLGDWAKCRHKIKLLHEGRKSKVVNARNFLAGNLADNSMREALEKAKKDPMGRLLSLSVDELLAPLASKWDHYMNTGEENRIYQWQGDPNEDQARILASAKESLVKLHPILIDNLLGRRFIPEFRPPDMPVFGIPGPDGEPCYIRLYLAVDCAVQVEEDPGNPNGVGKWGLFDLKTTSTQAYLDKSLPQLVFYDLGFQALTGSRPVEHALWAPLMKKPVQQVHVTDEHRAMVTNWIVTYCHSVWASEADFTQDPQDCYTCSTKSACPRFVTPMTRDEQGISKVHFGQREGMLHG